MGGLGMPEGRRNQLWVEKNRSHFRFSFLFLRNQFVGIPRALQSQLVRHGKSDQREEIHFSGMHFFLDLADFVLKFAVQMPIID